MTTFWPVGEGGWRIAHNPKGYAAPRPGAQFAQPFAAFDPRGKAILRKDGAIRTFGKFGKAAQAVFDAWPEKSP